MSPHRTHKRGESVCVAWDAEKSLIRGRHNGELALLYPVESRNTYQGYSWGNEMTCAVCSRCVDCPKTEQKPVEPESRPPNPLIVPNATGPAQPGTSYTEWGVSTCTNNGLDVETVYSGYATGALWGQSGGTVEYQCVTQTAEVRDAQMSTNAKNHNGGLLYHLMYKEGGIAWGGEDITQKGVPCAVCFVPEMSTYENIGAVKCPTGLQQLYSGYLMGSHHSDNYPTKGVCVNANAETLDGFCGPGKACSWIYPTEFQPDKRMAIKQTKYADRSDMEATCSVCARPLGSTGGVTINVPGRKTCPVGDQLFSSVVMGKHYTQKGRVVAYLPDTRIPPTDRLFN